MQELSALYEFTKSVQVAITVALSMSPRSMQLSELYAASALPFFCSMTQVRCASSRRAACRMIIAVRLRASSPGLRTAEIRNRFCIEMSKSAELEDYS